MRIMLEHPEVLNQMRKSVEGRYNLIINQTEEELVEQLKSRGKYHKL